MQTVKNIKYLLVILLVSVFYFLLAVTAHAAGNGDTQPVTVTYKQIEDIPTSLPDCDQIFIKVSDGAYSYRGWRNYNLGQFMSTKHKCLITLSVPELTGLDAYDVELNNEGDAKKHTNRYIMVTSEYLAWGEDNIIAEAELFVFDVNDSPTICITFHDGRIGVGMDKYVVGLHMNARESIDVEDWTDEWMHSTISTKVYQSDGYGMYNYAAWGSAAGGDKDFIWSCGNIEMSRNKRKNFVGYIGDYNTYLENKAKKVDWYKEHKKYWNDKNYNEFKLDEYVKSLGGTVTTTTGDYPYKTIRLNGNKITVGCFVDKECYDQWDVQEFKLNDSWVSWGETGYRTEKSNATFDTHCYQLRPDEYVPVKIGDNIYADRWDFDFLISLLDYCAK